MGDFPGVPSLVPAIDSSSNRTMRDVLGGKLDSPLGDSLVSHAKRQTGELITKSFRVTGTGALVAPMLEFSGAVDILNQYAHIESVTTLTNATDVYADIWDGAVATQLTKGAPGGAVLSGFGEASFFSKAEAETEPYTVFNSDQARVHEPSYKDIGKPFTINAKYGVQNTIRFHLTTTDAPIDFVVHVHFEFKLLHTGSALAFL